MMVIGPFPDWGQSELFTLSGFGQILRPKEKRGHFFSADIAPLLSANPAVKLMANMIYLDIEAAPALLSAGRANQLLSEIVQCCICRQTAACNVLASPAFGATTVAAPDFDIVDSAQEARPAGLHFQIPNRTEREYRRDFAGSRIGVRDTTGSARIIRPHAKYGAPHGRYGRESASIYRGRAVG